MLEKRRFWPKNYQKSHKKPFLQFFQAYSQQSEILTSDLINATLNSNGQTYETITKNLMFEKC